MATTSFDKLFIIENEQAIQILQKDLETPVTVQFTEKQQDDENKQALWQLEQFNLLS